MNLPTKIRIDELIDAHGSVARARESRLLCIARRAAEGKDSPCAKAEVAALDELPLNYATPAQLRREKNLAESFGD